MLRLALLTTRLFIADRIFALMRTHWERLRAMSEKQITRAAAISYNPDEDSAPILSAFGEGYLAEKIVAVAKESGVPVLPDPGLSSMLSKISVGDEIPEELYEAVAKVLIFVSEVDRGYGEKIISRVKQ